MPFLSRVKTDTVESWFPSRSSLPRSYIPFTNLFASDPCRFNVCRSTPSISAKLATVIYRSTLLTLIDRVKLRLNSRYKKCVVRFLIPSRIYEEKRDEVPPDKSSTFPQGVGRRFFGATLRKAARLSAASKCLAASGAHA